MNLYRCECRHDWLKVGYSSSDLFWREFWKFNTDSKILDVSKRWRFSTSFFSLVFRNALSANNARLNVEHNTITIIINSNYPYVFNLGDKTSKLYLTNVT